MQYSFFNIVFLAIALSSSGAIANAKPIGSADQQDIEAQPVSRCASANPNRNPNTQTVGAAYVITNGSNGNKVVAMDIGSDGLLSSVNTVDAGGNGAHGADTTFGPGPLFSQGAVTVNDANNILVTVNSASNTVAMFNIDPTDPSNLSAVGSPVPSGGEFPVSVAINKKGTVACILNGGQVNGVNCFTVDKTKGLVAKPNTLRSLGLIQTTPPTGPAGSVSQIIFSDDESKLFASVKGASSTPGFVATWDISPADGSLSAQPVKSTSANGLEPFGMSPIPKTNALLVADASAGFDVFDFGSSKASSKASSASTTSISGQGATSRVAFSPKIGNFYLSDPVTSLITELNVDKNLKGTVVKQHALQDASSAPLDLAVATIGGKDFLYVLTGNTTSVDVLSLTQAGAAQSVDVFNFGTALQTGEFSTALAFNLQGMAIFMC
ncbi:hypothetical protein CVT24_009307 [Panaeolus cyanescens]|uniref:3-carboxymuconate cyclase n=1 Tax=Panaeolus cyanescens TaxID=181874 RepID=A0A409Y845_9AGAR|nr:hypothetical protein CVT24_009307 [Panaeolus cyanescens]